MAKITEIHPDEIETKGYNEIVKVTQYPWSNIYDDGNAPANNSTYGATFARNISGFSWGTFFESLDGFYSSGASITHDRVELETPAIPGNSAEILKDPQWCPEKVSFDYDMVMETAVYFADSTNQEAWIIVGDHTDSSIGFKVDDNVLKGFINAYIWNPLAFPSPAFEWKETTVTLKTGVAVAWRLTAKFIAGNRIDFEAYDLNDDNLYTGSINTDLPTGSLHPDNKILNVLITTDEDVAKTMELYYWRFEQSYD